MPRRRGNGLIDSSAIAILGLVFVLPLLVCLLWSATTGAEEGAASFEAVAYHVVVRPDLARHSIEGRTRLVLERHGGGAGEITFPLHGLAVDEVSVDERSEPVRVEDDALKVAISARPRSSPLTLTVAYHGRPSQGLVFGADYVRTTWGPCRWMICDESPGRRARFEIEIVVPRDYQVVASGEAVARRPEPPNLTRHVWRQDRPYPSYLFGFAAGRFATAAATARGTKLRYFGIEDGPEALRRKFRDTARMLAFFEERAGVPFPFPAYSQILVPGAEAQEVSSFSLIGKEELDPILDDPREDWVVAHELAHQWWGNLLTCATWKDFWLNEGVTTFMVAAYKEKRWGREAYTREMDLARARYQRAVDAAFDVPLTFEGAYPSLGIKRAIVYSKGALFMDALRKEIGETAFWSGLRAYTRAGAAGSVESRDLQEAMEASAGRSLAGLFEAWVYGPRLRSRGP